MICPLCVREKVEFHRKSHIIPEWMYDDLYDKKHRMVNAELDKEFVNRKQKGYYEEYIICTDCEIESQKYDNYASLILTDRTPESPVHQAVTKTLYEETKNGRNYCFSRWEGIDFQMFQKFVFICVLRAHLASSRHGTTILAEKHFKGIRDLYKNNATNDLTYPITVVQFPEDDKFKNHVVLPFANRKNGHRFVEFSGAGYQLLAYVSSHTKPLFVYSTSLKSDGSMYLMHVYFEASGTFKSMNPTLADLSARFTKI